jgi:hypothetical protein
MNITLTGKIVREFEKKSGVSKNGNNWLNQDFLLEDEHGDKFQISLWGEDRIKNSGIKVGSYVVANCELKSKEWNGRWFLSLLCMDCFIKQGYVQMPNAQSAVTEQPSTPAAPMKSEPAKKSGIDGLPF